MTASQSDPGATGDPRDSLIMLVRYVRELELPPARWQRIAGIIEDAIDAAAAGDLAALRASAGALVLDGPTRIHKGDGQATGPAGPRIFERANFLIHALQSMSLAPVTPASPPPGRADDAGDD
ncbi:MAG TPA: CATRA system-associated protein [Trebonia sp.]|nr:CATRA system-associated protein [Trebonia sp.]